MKKYIFLTTVISLLCWHNGLDAQFFRVYGYMTAEAREKELVMWNSYIPSSDLDYSFFGENVVRDGLPEGDRLIMIH